MGNPLAELGLAVDEKLSVEHALTQPIVLSMTKSMEEAVKHTLVTITKSSKEINRVIKIVGYAAATYLVLAGVARVIEASTSRPKEDDKDAKE
mmetsp:Transcript_10430/g.13195  ORF Transcript_10430/g.13195 Transcript_10430/m.13195 type:complete len:93 (+) Transcript_10430:82-360(+)|eukprot:CAMPEP_0203646718 /NCGR_PEP_ID=MMETSP0088-20131115/13626_1 /ASSEMBLY_ACC=CAM_ASM_001087 /TAXON_ID=426623 /ORGANISM="Chaetoceros affinis, Strain CCMP159" /LENGTH=92 /DNA_ID=CAMNT_0050504045 /DNA_START=38 /DNA_END=319 /DNA_ORIENTATION=+